MRNKQAFKNLWGNLLLQIIVAVSGLVLPRFFLNQYGSTVNGMINSVSQFLTYLNLVEAGISSAAIVELYGPLNNNDTGAINSVLSALQKFYYKSGGAYIILLTIMTVVYPFFVASQIDSLSTRILILILAASNLVDFFFIGKYRVLLTADQRGYVIFLTQAAATLVNMGVSIVLIKLGCSFLVVKGVATGLYIARFIFVYIYAKRKYKYMNFKTSFEKGLLKQRWAALLHQIVGVIVNNTDIVILTLFMGATSLQEVSVYTTYNMVAVALTSLLSVFSNGITSSFGSLIFSNDKKALKNAFSNYEYFYMIVLFCIYTCCAVLLLPFVKIYTAEVTDGVQYVRQNIAFLFVILGLVQNIRIPSLTMICAAGHFKETQGRAILEAVINIVVSLALIKPLGMAGILFGTVVSYSYRSIDCIIYNNKYLVNGTIALSVRRIVRNVAVSLLTVFAVHKFLSPDPQSLLGWLVWAVITAVISGVLIVAVNAAVEPAQLKQLFERGKSALKRV